MKAIKRKYAAIRNRCWLKGGRDRTCILASAILPLDDALCTERSVARFIHETAAPPNLPHPFRSCNNFRDRWTQGSVRSTGAKRSPEDAGPL